MGITTPVTNQRIATCPHGLPPGACPICNGGGGGGSSTKRLDEPRKAGEMSYQECYAMWKQMQRAEARETALKEAALQNALMQAKFQQALNNISLTLQNALANIQKSLPEPVSKALSTVINNVIMPIINLIKELPAIKNNFVQAFNNIKSQIEQAAQKLAAIIGEINNFVEKKISESIKSLKKRLRGILNIFGLEEEYEEDKKVNQEMKIFKEFEVEKLKTTLKILKEFKNKEEELEQATS